jgi:ammonia channel protein AmtB
MTVFFMFQLMFAVITPALIIGAIADRWAIHLCKIDTVDVPWVRPCLSTL